jgi:peptidyl-prolyl cis-trans isomerase C
MVKAPGIVVNGIPISIEQINEEVQYHPADSLEGAKYEAMRALVIRELLVQEAVEKGILDQENAMKNPEETVDKLLEQEISVPEAAEETCRHYYESNKRRFYTAPLFQAAHIFFPAPPGDEEARKAAHEKATEVLKAVQDNPGQFGKLAKTHSACSSKSEGGQLGQITKGQTVPAFEAALHKMKAGELSAEPVETEVGFHIIKVYEREDGKLLPFENVKDWTADFLKQQSWQRAVSQYIQILAGKAEISGFRMEGAETPLVQ